MKRVLKPIGLILVIGLAYLLLWPVPIDPVAWDAPENKGYVGDFASNTRLSGIKRIDLGEYTGPEDVALGPDGKIYTPTHEGVILRIDPDTGAAQEFASTGGRALGITFGKDGTLYVADAYEGLFAINQAGEATLLANKTDNESPIPYADGVDVTDNGSVYFSDASVKFGAKQNGGTLPASLLDLLEHGPNGRILKYDPDTKSTTTILDGLSFANGVALTQDQSHLLIVETGTYSILKLPLDGSAKATSILSNLPGFPDNIKRNADGTFWVGLVSPRSKPVDDLSGKPFMRKIIQRLPAFIQPKPQRYAFLMKIDENGNVIETLQDPTGAYALVTGAIEMPNGDLAISSLTEPDLGMLRK